MESYTKIVINKVKHYSKQVGCLSVLLALTACGSSGGGSGQEPPQASLSSATSSAAQSSSPGVASSLAFESPSEITATENTPFRFQVSAKGDGTIRYQLLETPDAQYFELDEVTGLLTAKQNFDFEAPVDAGQDGIFNLSVSALSSFDLQATTDITIQLENTKEYIAQVEFPPEGANIGGFAETFTVRGIATKLNGDPITDNSIMAITVNGVGAEFLPDAPAQWFAEVPVNAGENVFTIEAKDSDTMIKTARRKVTNNPVQNFLINRAYTADGKYAYALDTGERGIVKIDIDGRSAQPLISLNSLSLGDSAEVCVGLVQLELSANEKNLFIDCFTKTGIGFYIAYDLENENKDLNFISRDIGFTSAPPMHYSERYDILSLPTSNHEGSALRLYVFDNETGKAVPIFVKNGEDAVTEHKAFLHNGFIQIGKDYRVSAKDVVDLAASELSSDNTSFESLSIGVETNVIAISPDFFSGAFLLGHYYESDDEGVIFQYDAAGQLLQSFDIPFAEDAPSNLRGSLLKAFGSDQLIILNRGGRQTWIFNPLKSEFLEIPRDTSDPRFQRLFTKETSLNLTSAASFEALKKDELVYFSYIGRKLEWFSKSTHDVTKSINLKYTLDELADINVVAALSEAKEKLFISSRTNGFSVRDLGFYERDPVVVGFNYDEQSSSFKTLLTDAQLTDLLGHEKDQYFYTVKGLHYDSQRQRLYSAVIVNRNFRADFSLDYSDDESLYMLEYDDDSEVWRSHAYVSPELIEVDNISPNWISDSLILESFIIGSNLVLCQDYCATTTTLDDGLVKSFSAALWLDGKEKLLHFDTENPFQQGARLLESSLDSTNSKVISDILADNGPTIYRRYHYDSEHNALFSNVDDFIVMVDALTGDRVFVAKNESDAIASSHSGVAFSVSSTASN